MKSKNLLAWLVLGVGAVIFLVWAFPRTNPLFPQRWSVSRDDAEAHALEIARDLGELPDDPYVIVNASSDWVLQARLRELLERGVSAETIQESRVFRDFYEWRVTIYNRTNPSWEWVYRVRVAPRGEVTQLEKRLRDEEGTGAADPASARERAGRFLRDQGIELAHYDDPQLRTTDLETRTDTSLKYRDREALLGESIPYGIEVRFAGDELVGFRRYVDDPEGDVIDARFQRLILWNQVWVFMPILLLLLVAVPFVRRYHAGEIGVRRGLQIAGVVAACGVVVMLMCGRGAGEGWNIGVLTRPQVIMAVTFQMTVLFFVPMAVMTLLSWSVGESMLRERWGQKLAGLDALFRGEWRNATFARAALRGTVGGLLLAALTWGLLLVGAKTTGAYPLDTLGGPPWWPSVSWFSIPLVLFSVAYAAYTAIFGVLFLVPLLGRWLGKWGGALGAALLAAFLFFPPIAAMPSAWMFLLGFVLAAGSVLLFLRYGAFAVVLAQFVAGIVPAVLPLLTVDDPSMQLHASLALLFAAVPLILGARYLASDEEFVYRYEDVPPHVRRIAERERQKVELETARGIQASILPELPHELNGVKLAHTYLPATEVGGDFYDVLALEDGRLAVAVGDVAGHGVSSGLVMSMAKSALAVQVTFNPNVEAVLGTLNRMVFQSARKRLLATLCYAVVDPRRREMFYASAGHLFPYRIGRDGRVEALESVSYPLGVRDRIEVRVRAANLEAGDSLFLFSDGIVEARPEGSDEQFGFDRLEESLRRHRHAGVEGLKEGVLSDLYRFTGAAPMEDDLTLLVLQLPDA